MNRKDFLNSMGMSAAAYAIINCTGCKKSTNGSNDNKGPTNIDFNLDLNSAENAVLLNNGGSLLTNDVIVAKTTAGIYIAVQRSCTHERYNLNYQSNNNRFYCANHGATFSESGVVTNGPASKSLVVYRTQLTGTSLRIYS